MVFCPISQPQFGLWELVKDVLLFKPHFNPKIWNNLSKGWLQLSLDPLRGVWTAGQTSGCKYVTLDHLSCCWLNRCVRFKQHGGFHNMVVFWPRRCLVSSASAASFPSCGRPCRKVWKVAIETASAKETQHRGSSTRWRSRFGEEKKAAPDFIISFQAGCWGFNLLEPFLFYICG